MHIFLPKVYYWRVCHGLRDKDTRQTSAVCRCTSTKFKAKLPFSLSSQRFSAAVKPPLSPASTRPLRSDWHCLFYNGGSGSAPGSGSGPYQTPKASNPNAML